ncbi:lipid storage droplets surface-binding protein 1 isoform X2 [Microplitis demolitor]|uniref:lipid storage droplets surface-binding protein 1 isoform X2 n=1 Tax=Microplitis demolitor TaxID=69319 RepID=UPI0004CD508E|nr:lipid storage droplets surface-binding protein 1 isoform X2 [Microplitis demolitor]
MATLETIQRRHSNFHMESVSRISNLPIVETGIKIASNVYNKMKRSNSLINWSLGTAEHSLEFAAESVKPAILMFDGPISSIDHFLCQSIDIVEQRVPYIYLPPQLLYTNTREFMNNKFVRPVLKRAGSVKQIGSQAANVAADTLDGALTVVDKYVDHYLPAVAADNAVETEGDPKLNVKTSKTARTIQHGARFSRKLKKRLTRRTLAEAQALKNQGIECVHIFMNIFKLIVTDPKMAYKKSKEMWAVLSLAEPENQERPHTIDQLLVLLTRESARRMVHLINATTAFATRTPRRIKIIMMTVSHQLLSIAEATLKVASKSNKRGTPESQISTLESTIKNLNSTINILLERIAVFLAGRPKSQKLSPSQLLRQNHNNHTSASILRPLNGID